MTAATRSTQVWKVQHQQGHKVLTDFTFLYYDWIYPNTLETFRDKDVLDAGSGPGVQVRLFADVARSVTAVDLEALDVTSEKTREVSDRVRYVRDDISSMDLKQQFDVVNCVGVIHHTDDPTQTFRNLWRHLKPGGRMIVWAYAREGNALVRGIVEPLRKRFLDHASHATIQSLSYALTLLMWPAIQTVYRLPLPWLPYHEYFGNFRRLSFQRNVLNVYDKLNAPQQHFISRAQIESWFDPHDFEDVHISQYKGVSWRASGTRRRS